MVGVDDSSYRQTHSPSLFTWSEGLQSRDNSFDSFAAGKPVKF